MEPRILLTTTLHWPGAARLAIAFANLGCRVEGLCPYANPLSHTRAARKIYIHSALRPLASLRAAIRATRPDLIIPCDDNAAVNLHRLYESTPDKLGWPRVERATIERSAACTLAAARAPLLTLAVQQGVRIPKTAQVACAGELSAFRASGIETRRARICVRRFTTYRGRSRSWLKTGLATVAGTRPVGTNPGTDLFKAPAITFTPGKSSGHSVYAGEQYKICSLTHSAFARRRRESSLV